MINWMLLAQFAQFGLLCFGGGYMIIPLLMQALVIETPVLTMETFANLLSVSQMTPGAVSINMATYVGFLKNGVSGALFASFGLVLPTLLISMVVLRVWHRWKDGPALEGLLKGVRLAALAMIGFAVFIFINLSVLTQPVSLDSLREGGFAQGEQTSFLSIDFFNLGAFMIGVFFVLKAKMPVILIAFLAAAAGALRGGFF